MQRTIPVLFEESIKKYPENIQVWEKVTGEYVGFKYYEMRDIIYKFSAGLMSYGLKKGDRSALISEGRSRWIASELGVLYAGAINVPITTKIEELNDLKFRLVHSGSKFVIVSQSQAEKIRKIKHDLPDLEKIILLDDIEKTNDEELYFQEVMLEGENYLKLHQNEFGERWQNIKESDYANICYTSGTTADPKGIILTHRNYTANVEQCFEMLYLPEHFVNLCILPWDHAFTHTAGVYLLMKHGASIASVQLGKTPLETLKNIPGNIKEIKPYFMYSVPALAKNFRKNIENGIREKGRKVENLFHKALEIAYKYNAEGFNKGKGSRILLKPLYTIYDKLIFSKIRENFGGRLEFFIGGGAALDIELQRFFYALGIPMLQGYGLTESAPVISTNTPDQHKLGTSGRILPGITVKIVDEKGNETPTGTKGEIIVKGENVMVGYWMNERATKETLKDGWLYTGDIGYLDEDGYIYVLGRIKSLLIGNDGEKYSPEGIEEAFTEQTDFIDQVMLYNSQSQYTVALVVPNRETILKWLKNNSLNQHNEEGQKSVLKKIESEIGKFKSGGEFAGQFPEKWLPAAVAILGEGFTEENKFINSTLKMVRPKITDFYKNRIDYLLTPEGKDICNRQNMTIISRV
ncbi:MAG TPA: AMP-binding protein [Ignavibacteriaceae bacterium]|nr:AMP-binding protein [Ignavibacteriaceae bacterium]